MTFDNTKNIEETSAMAAGAVEVSPQNKEEEQNEERLRSIIRESIRAYAKKKQMLRKEELQEQRLRQAVRKLVLSEKASKDPAPTSTLEGVMRSLLNNIVPQIRLDYMKLQTNNEERQGFKDYFYNAVAQSIDVAHDQMNPEDTDQELAEQEKIVVKSDDPDFIDGVSDGTEPADEKKPEGKQSTKNISSYYDRGQNFGETAFTAVKDRIENAVYSQIVPEEYEQFVKVLNANLQAWFKIWDTNQTQDQTRPVDAADQEPEAEAGLGEVEPETASGDQQDFDLGSEEPLEEDFEIELE